MGSHQKGEMCYLAGNSQCVLGGGDWRGAGGSSRVHVYVCMCEHFDGYTGTDI